MGIGGEHTGWALVRVAGESPIDVDISRIRSSAQALNGQRVTITGQMVEKRYVERGVVRVLLAERIAPVEA